MDQFAKMGKEESTASAHGAAAVSDEICQALGDRQFTSLAEVQAFLDQHVPQRNRRPVDEFHGLSPEQMHRMLNFPVTSPELVRFPEVVDTAPAAPILTLFSLLVEAISEQGLKPTAKGNLPRKFCRDAALIYWGEETYGGAHALWQHQQGRRFPRSAHHPPGGRTGGNRPQVQKPVYYQPGSAKVSGR
jgi:hypothetical protein